MESATQAESKSKYITRNQGRTMHNEIRFLTKNINYKSEVKNNKTWNENCIAWTKESWIQN